MSARKTFVYIGGGAAGFFAAIHCAKKNPDGHHIILEATQRVMTKIKMSGGGRCNVTHHCFDPNVLVQNYPRGSKELKGAFARFQPKDTVSWFEDRGVALKAEADGRMFPTTDKSETIIQCLTKEAETYHVEVRKGAMVKQISRLSSEEGFLLTLQGGQELKAHRIFLSTGSFPIGHDIAKSLGHHIVDPVPSLFTFNCTHPLLEGMMGTAFPTAAVNLNIKIGHSVKAWNQKGPLLITHWGLSGPAVLKLSAFAARELYESEYQGELTVNWLGLISAEQAFQTLADLKDKAPKQSVAKLPLFNLSRRFTERVLELIFGPKYSLLTWGEISKKHLRDLATQLTASKINVTGKGVFKEEFVTCGGVDLKEVNFKTMESKITTGLYFAGEVLDIDGVTGGFNFQAAWTTSWLAAQNM